MRAALIALGASTVALLAMACVRPVVESANGNGPEAARAIWEEAIRAKGGRERLHAVRNFVESSDEPFRIRRRDIATHVYIERLSVPPTRYWEFDDFRPGKMGHGGVGVDTNQHRVLNEPNRGPAQGLYEDLVYRLRNEQIVYLMETAWVQPEPVAVRRDRLGRLTVDVVETRVADDRVEFSLDRTTHLPIRILIVEKRVPRLPEVDRLSDYRPIDGIQMPSHVHFGEGETKSITTYRFDVDYDESVFNRRSVRFEKNGWMKR